MKVSKVCPDGHTLGVACYRIGTKLTHLKGIFFCPICNAFFTAPPTMKITISTPLQKQEI